MEISDLIGLHNAVGTPHGHRFHEDNFACVIVHGERLACLGVGQFHVEPLWGRCISRGTTGFGGCGGLRGSLAGREGSKRRSNKPINKGIFSRRLRRLVQSHLFNRNIQRIIDVSSGLFGFDAQKDVEALNIRWAITSVVHWALSLAGVMGTDDRSSVSKTP